jgi:hypothetical protein
VRNENINEIKQKKVLEYWPHYKMYLGYTNVWSAEGHHDIQHNATQHNDIQHTNKKMRHSA